MSRKPLVSDKPKPLRPVHPNAGLTEWYQRRLDVLIDQMQRSVARAIGATYKRNPPVMAEDASTPADMVATMNRLGREWSKRFEEFGATIGRKFSKDAVGNADRSFAASLKAAGFTVKLQLTPAANEVLRATMAEQVNLIRSIPSQYLTQVQSLVMQSVRVGGDMATLTKQLEHQFGVTKRRAATIARDQNSKATSAITAARQIELGITEAKWLHSSGARQPRPTHVANSGKVYNIKEGWLDPAINRRTWPGYEINCGCVSIPIIPGADE